MKAMARFGAIFGLAVGLAIGLAQAQTASSKTKVRKSINPAIYSCLPIYPAVDRGCFAAENLEVETSKYTGFSVSQMPLAARGNLDIIRMVGGSRQGTDIRAMAIEPRLGSMKQGQAGGNSIRSTV